MKKLSREEFDVELALATQRFKEAIESQPTFPNLVASRVALVHRLWIRHDPRIGEGQTENSIYLAIIGLSGRFPFFLLTQRARELTDQAWEYYLRQFAEEQAEVTGRFGPHGDMQGSDHPLRRD